MKLITDEHFADLGPGMEPLDWNTRMKIAAGSAQGLDYLHNQADPPVIYRDLKSSNILLDHGFHPKLSDLGSQSLHHKGTSHMSLLGSWAPMDIVPLSMLRPEN